MKSIGITERGDPAIHFSGWVEWVGSGKPTILITKNPRVVLATLKSCLFPINVIVHCTITGHGGSVYEPGVPKPEDALTAYRKLIEFLGPDRVVLRIDPIFPNQWEIAKEIFDCRMGTRVRVSFLDNYDHVKKRFLEVGLRPLPYEFHAPLEERLRILDEFPGAEVCAEPGIPCVGCVSEKDCQILGVEPEKNLHRQRIHCRCVGNKLELMNNPERCPHGCLYCYWF